MSHFTLPDLPYRYDALDPYMSAETLTLHHDKHHQAYITKANDLIEGSGLAGKSLEEAMVAAYRENKQGLFNQLGQIWNHNHFWQMMTPNGGGKKMPGELEKALNDSFGGFDGFKDKFTGTAATLFGSGWCWLAMDGNGKLEVMNTPNGENPVVHGKAALLGIDMWEHSYYVDYRNEKAKYLNAFCDNLINWEYVAELYQKGPVKIAA